MASCLSLEYPTAIKPWTYLVRLGIIVKQITMFDGE